MSSVQSINGNLVTGITDNVVAINEVVYILPNDGEKKRGASLKLKAEVIRVRGREFDAQVFEDTRDIRVGQTIQLSGELLSIELGPGLLGQVFDGLLHPLAKNLGLDGISLKRGQSIDPVDKRAQFEFMPVVSAGNVVGSGQVVGLVKEGCLDHRICVPLSLLGRFEVLDIAPKKTVIATDVIARIENILTKSTHDLTLLQKWPIKTQFLAHAERLRPEALLTTTVRMVDALFPIAEGGTACVVGPSGSGKTVFIKSVAEAADADVVIIAACGERACEVVETISTFPKLLEPHTGRSLMERTIVVCNSAAMPVAARDAALYTAMTVAEYYRQMGLKVLVLIDSLSRWAEALREINGRLVDIPGDEGFPVYLGSALSAFYERAGLVRVDDKNLGSALGSITLIGTVTSGHGDESVADSALSAVGCCLRLSEARSIGRQYPAISPLLSWSKYRDSPSLAADDGIDRHSMSSLIQCLETQYAHGQAIGDQMQVVGEDDVSLKEFVEYLKSEFFDAVFLQQNGYDDGADLLIPHSVPLLLQHVRSVVEHDFSFSNKLAARRTFIHLTALFHELFAHNNPEAFAECLREIKVTMSKNGRGEE